MKLNYFFTSLFVLLMPLVLTANNTKKKTKKRHPANTAHIRSISAPCYNDGTNEHNRAFELIEAALNDDYELKDVVIVNPQPTFSQDRTCIYYLVTK